MIEESVKRLKVGDIYKNYKVLCEILGEEPKKANSKKAQLKEWNCYFTFEKEGQKHIITEIFETKKEKERAKETKPRKEYKMSEDCVPYYLYKLICNKVLTSEDGLNNFISPTFITCPIDLLKEFHVISQDYQKKNYQKKDKNDEDKEISMLKNSCLIVNNFALTKKDNITVNNFDMEEYYERAYKIIADKFSSAITSIEKNGYISANRNRYYWTADKSIHKANKEQLIVYNQINEWVLKYMGASKISQAIKYNKNLYFDLLIQKLKENKETENWCATKMMYEITVHNIENLKSVDEKVISYYMFQLNNKFNDAIDNNAQTTYKRRKYKIKEKYPLEKMMSGDLCQREKKLDEIKDYVQKQVKINMVLARTALTIHDYKLIAEYEENETMKNKTKINKSRGFSNNEIVIREKLLAHYEEEINMVKSKNDVSELQEKIMRDLYNRFLDVVDLVYYDACLEYKQSKDDDPYVTYEMKQYKSLCTDYMNYLADYLLYINVEIPKFNVEGHEGNYKYMTEIRLPGMKKRLVEYEAKVKNRK